MKYLYLSFTLCLYSYSGFSQDFNQQLKSFMGKIQHAESISYVSDITIDYTTGPMVKQKIIYSRSLDAIYYKTDKMEMLGDSKISLMIYPEEKVVVWQKTDPSTDALKSKEQILSDTLVSTSDSIVYKGVSDGFHQYVVYTKKKYINKTELSFGVQDGILHQAVYHYDQSQNFGVRKSTVDFVTFQINGVQGVSKRPDSVLEYKDKTYSLRPGFTGYKLIHLDHTY